MALDPSIAAGAAPGTGIFAPWVDLLPEPAKPPEQWLKYVKQMPVDPNDRPPQLVRTVNLLPAPAHGISSPDDVHAIADFILKRARQGIGDIFAHPDYASASGPGEAWARAIAEHQTGIPYTQPAYFYDGGQSEVTQQLVTRGRYPLAGQCQQSVTTALAMGGWDGGKWGDIGSGIDAQPYCASLGEGLTDVPPVLAEFSDALWNSIGIGSCLFWSAPCPTTRDGQTCGGSSHAPGCGKGSGHVAMVIRKHPKLRKWQLWDTTTSFNDPLTHAAAGQGARMLWESHWWDWIPQTLSGGSWVFRGIARIKGLGQLRAGLRPRGRARLLLRRRGDDKLLFRSPWLSLEKENLPVSWLLRSLRGAPFHAEIEPTWCINSARDVPGPNAPDNRPLLDCTCTAEGHARMSWKPQQGLHNRPRVSDWSPEEAYAEKAAPKPPPPAPVPLNEVPLELGIGSPAKPKSKSPGKPPAAPAPAPAPSGGAPGSGVFASALLRGEPALAPIAQGKGSLEKGERGDAVKALQVGLVALGLPVPGGADGVFGKGTTEAVKRFQGDHGLGVDGVVGKATVHALDKALLAQGK
ncbi:peptidoglycan-binding domain-containing protein [Polyangium aurulentum]|uniref:peptidoglycan-binding domain-containing protein n=1 Tax=Polyangium aurulentum TaxID=2567896 RepID=UPI0010AEB5C1|nr:peptidoglycan-binding domain-containing protein [Polyangium aurulentum]UQA63405.1 peptidoglycan-binding protein [Polyangium aurulentum]